MGTNTRASLGCLLFLFIQNSKYSVYHICMASRIKKALRSVRERMILRNKEYPMIYHSQPGSWSYVASLLHLICMI
jgi:hypothetical protein